MLALRAGSTTVFRKAFEMVSAFARDTATGHAYLDQWLASHHSFLHPKGFS
jgi:hypothetical protein